jgi:predicted regulator of Ras-like GTPase activity (Roadblock/LC7/MglB family)
MHWLSEQLTSLDAAADRFARSKHDRPGLEAHGAREAFRRALDELASGIGKRAGVTAAFVAHEGLVLATAGNVPSFEALAATAQVTLSAGKSAATGLSLGGLRQMVLIGEDHKLALFIVGQMALGILAPCDVNLAAVLGQ